MEILNPREQYMLPVEHAIDQYYSDKSPFPAYHAYVTKEHLSSRFYDDNQWISNVLLYQITKDKKYLNEARRIAKAGRLYFFKNGRLPNGNYWFNAVMLRGYEAWYKMDKNKASIDFYKQDAETIWDTERDANNMIGPNASKKLIDQAAMIEIYARLQQ